MAELRHKGLFLERFETAGDASAYLADRARRYPSEDASVWTIEADRPIRLLCGGSVVETFHTYEDAHADVARRREIEAVEAPKHPRVYTMDPPEAMPEPA